MFLNSILGDASPVVGGIIVLEITWTPGNTMSIHKCIWISKMLRQELSPTDVSTGNTGPTLYKENAPQAVIPTSPACTDVQQMLCGIPDPCSIYHCFMLLEQYTDTDSSVMKSGLVRSDNIFPLFKCPMFAFISPQKLIFLVLQRNQRNFR